MQPDRPISKNKFGLKLVPKRLLKLDVCCLLLVSQSAMKVASSSPHTSQTMQ